MKNIIILSLILTSSIASNAQGRTEKSDLRIKIDSIIEYQLKPQIIDSTSLIGQISNCLGGNEKSKPIVRLRSSLPNTTMPIIILDGRVLELEELNNYNNKDLSALHVYDRNSNVTALYGSDGQNGVIIIQLKKRIRRKYKRPKRKRTITSFQ